MKIKILPNALMPYYGKAYEARISRATALTLVRKRFAEGTLPRMGYAIDLLRQVDDWGDSYVFTIENRGGDFFACCLQATMSEWPRLFDITFEVTP